MTKRPKFHVLKMIVQPQASETSHGSESNSPLFPFAGRSHWLWVWVSPHVPRVRAPAATAPAAATAAADQAANQAAQQAAQQAAALAALSADELKTRGRQALREQRIYSPAGNNAMEYYLALRKKSDKPDASAESALMDLQPYAVIAAEQAITRQDFVEAERLRSLIAAADPQAPSLTRIADAIAKGKSLAAQQQAADATPNRGSGQGRRSGQAARRHRKPLAAQRPQPPPSSAPTADDGRDHAPAAPAQAQAQAPARSGRGGSAAAACPGGARAGPGARRRAIWWPSARRSRSIRRRRNAAGPLARWSSRSRSTPTAASATWTSSARRPRGVFERSVQSAVRRWKFEPISGPQTRDPHLRPSRADRACRKRLATSRLQAGNRQSLVEVTARRQPPQHHACAEAGEQIHAPTRRR